MQEQIFTPVNFAQHLAALIRQRGITQKELAAGVGSSEATIVKWLKGSVPLGPNLNRLADYFGIHPDYLLNPKRYTQLITDAAAEAEAIPDVKRRARAFNEKVLQETKRLYDRQEGFDAAMTLREHAAAYGTDWQGRAISAERQLAELKTLLQTALTTITLPLP